MLSNTSTRFARIAIVGMAALAIAGCSSDSKDAAKKVEKIKPAASVTKEVKSTTTTAPPAPSTTAAPSTPPCTTAAAQAALAPDTVDAIVCNGPWAAGAANNTHVDYAYLLQAVDGAWQKAPASVQNELCTTNPQGLPASFVGDACND